MIMNVHTYFVLIMMWSIQLYIIVQFDFEFHLLITLMYQLLSQLLHEDVILYLMIKGNSHTSKNMFQL